MQQQQELYDNDCSSISSVEPNEDQDLSSLHNSEKTIESQASQESDSNVKTKDPNEILQAEELQMMVQNYKQIGGELRFNIKVLESKCQYLNKNLSEKSHECEMLAQQKDFQMKTLVDLQIRLENLDMERVKFLTDSQRDKSEMTELFSNEMQTALENDDCIGNTYNKFNEIVKLEKQDDLLKNSKAIVESHAKSGEEYFMELKETNISSSTSIQDGELQAISGPNSPGDIELTLQCDPLEVRSLPNMSDNGAKKDKQAQSMQIQGKYDTLNEEKSNLTERINQAKEEFQSIKAKETILQQQIFLAEEEISNIKEKIVNLEKLFEQGKQLLNENEDNYKKLESNFEEKLLQLNNDILNNKIKLDCEVNVNDLKEKYENLSQEKLIQDNLHQSHEELVVQLSKAEEDFLSIKQELYLLNEEYLLAAAQLEDAKKEENILQVEAGVLPSVIDVLNDLKNKEIIVTEVISSAETNITVKEEIYNQLIRNEKSLEGELEILSKNVTDWKENLTKSEKEVFNLSEISRQHCENYGLQLSGKYKEFKKIKTDGEELLAEENELDFSVKDLETQIDDSKSECNALINLKEELDEEINQLNLMEEEIETLNHKYMELTSSKSSIEDDLSTVTKYLEEGSDVKSLEAEILQISFEISESTINHDEQMNSMEMSYQSQKKNWENKMSKEIKEIERRTAKIEARTRKMSDAVPRRNQQLINLEADLKKSSTVLMKEMQIRLNMLEEMAKFYAQSLKNPNRKELKANVLRNLESIDQHIVRPMKCMMALSGIPRISLDQPTQSGYKTVLNAFKEKYFLKFQNSENNASLEMSNKIREIGNCMFGKKWIEPTYSEVLNDTEISSSTTDIYY